jgi:hypothetical protein
MSGDAELSDLPNALSGLIELRVRRGGDVNRQGVQSESDDEVMVFCDSLLQSLCALRFVPSAALLQQILFFARNSQSQRAVTATVDSLLASCRAVGVPRWCLCSSLSADTNDQVWDLLCYSLAVFAKSTNELGTPTRTAASSRQATRRGGGPATNGGRARPRRGGTLTNSNGAARRRGRNADESSGESERDDEILAADDIADVRVDFVTPLERDRHLELLRFFATLFETERSAAVLCGRSTLAQMLLMPDRVECDGDDDDYPTTAANNFGLLRAEQRYVTRVEKLATLVVRCFRCLEYLPHDDEAADAGDDPDLLTPASARVIAYAQQIFHALNVLVGDDDEVLQSAVSIATQRAFNFLPTIHSRVLFVESLRHRAQKLRWLDALMINNFSDSRVRNKKRVKLLPPSVHKFVLVYMDLKYSNKDESAALRSLDLYVVLLLHVALELLNVVRDERERGVPSTVLQPLAAYGHAISSNQSGSSSNNHTSTTEAFHKIWFDNLREEILQQTEEERPHVTDATLFRMQLLERTLGELALAQTLVPAAATSE